jgi:hypothetical protein
MKYNFTLHEDAWFRDGPAIGDSQVIGYRVGGMPDGSTARIANFGAPTRDDWRDGIETAKSIVCVSVSALGLGLLLGVVIKPLPAQLRDCSMSATVRKCAMMNPSRGGIS